MMANGYHAQISDVYLLHAGDDFERIKVGIEDVLQLQNQVNVKRRYKERDNVAEELLRLMRKVEGEGQESRGVVIISQRLCEVMKNNKGSSQTFQDLIMRDVRKPEGERRFALVWFENDDPAASRDLFREAFSCAFVDRLEQDSLGLVRWESSSWNGPMQEAAVREMLKQWFGPAAHLGDPKMDEEPNIPDVETVRIVHGGAKQAVREIGNELEEGFQLEDTIKYKLYNRVLENKIPEIVLAEVMSIREADGPKALGVIVWCPKFLEMMRDSTCKEKFQHLVLSLDPHRLVHLCYQVNEYEVKRFFPALEGKDFLPIHVNAEDGTVEVTDLTIKVQDVLGKVKKGTKRQDSSFRYDMPPHSKPKPDDHQPISTERQFSEPSALASEDTPRPQILLQASAFAQMQPRVGLVGNPSNQTPQGGRVVLPGGGSFSVNSAGYGSSSFERMGQGSSGRMPAQPAERSSMEGRMDQNWKIVANGSSFNGLPSRPGTDPQSQEIMMAHGIGSHGLGSYHPSDGSGSTNNAAGASGSGSCSTQACAGGGQQVSASGASNSSSRCLADGEHSMPLTSFPSQSFGSLEPVLPSRDTTLESCPGSSMGSLPAMPSGSSLQYPSSLPTMNMSSHCAPQSMQSFGALSMDPASNRVTPSGHTSTELARGGPLPPYMEAAGSQPPTSVNPGPRQLEESHLPSYRKIPRREEVSDISSAGPAAFANLGPQRGFIPTSSSCNNLSQGGASGQASYLSMSNNGQIASTVPPVAASPVLPANESNDFNISGLESNVSNQPARSVVKPFVQCTADGSEGTFANNPPSNDAFRLQDYGELGPGRNLPNQQVGSDFKSLPAAGQRCGSENDGMERVNSSPASLEQTAKEIAEASLDPSDHPIRDMHYRCRQGLSILLDPDCNTGCDWKVFAYHFKMSFTMIRFLQSKQRSQTAELLDWLMQNKPDVTCGLFKQVARQHQRMDVVRMMEKFNY